MPLQIDQFMARSDNFGVLVHDPDSKATLCIDAPEEQPVLDALERTGWNLTHILITHHHPDHTDAIKPLKHRFTPKVIGPRAEAGKIGGLDETVDHGDTLELCGETVNIIGTPGHTAGHIVYHLPKSGLLFAADTLFAMGCGRLFEGSPGDMQLSFDRLKALPDETMVYCGHEYTLSNARFAVTVDPDNRDLAERLEEVEALRKRDEPTLPTTLAKERATNPFMRTDDAAIRRHLGMEDATDAEVFGELRRRKDDF